MAKLNKLASLASQKAADGVKQLRQTASNYREQMQLRKAQELNALSAEERQLRLLRDECYAMVNKSSLQSGAVAAIPIPGVDLANDVTILMNLIPKINEKFGLSPEQIDALDPKQKEITLIAITKIGTSLIGRFLTRDAVLKTVTSAGTKLATTATAKTGAKIVPMLGPVISGGISYGAMRFVGRSHVNDCYQVALEVLQKRQLLLGYDKE